MIVAGTDIIAHLYLPTEQTDHVVSVLHKDPHWLAPLLWRNQFRNMLALYVRKNIIGLKTAISMQSQAERQFADNEYTINSMDVLARATETGCCAYDCEFVSLASAFNLKLVTGDKKPVQTFSGIAMTPRDYLRAEQESSYDA